MSQNKCVVLVTGASSGIGRASAEYLAARGWRVYAGARRPEVLEGVPEIEPIQLDVTADESAAQAVSKILTKEGRIDGLVNNAGTSLMGSIEEASIAQARSLFETNVMGVLRMSQLVLPAMRERRQGRIVNISSVAGFLPAPYMGLYAATKHAIEGLSESMDHEVRTFGVRILVVEPAFTRTNIDAASARAANLSTDYAVQRERVLTNIAAQIAKSPLPNDVAEVVERALNAKSFQRLPVGSQARILSRLRKLAPAGMIDRSVRQAFSLDG